MKYDTLIIFILFLCIFLIIMFRLGEFTDFTNHVQIAIDMKINNSLFQGNFIMYYLLNLFSFFSADLNIMKTILCVLLAISTTLKYEIIKRYFLKFATVKHSILISSSLLFIFIIPVLAIFKSNVGLSQNYDMYIGYFVPNVWHNSTTIFLFPFAIWLYLVSIKQLDEFSDKRNFLILFLVLINIFIKPSFFFVFSVVYPLMLLYKYRFKIQLWKSLFPIITGVFCVIFVFLTIYKSSSNNSNIQLSTESLFSHFFLVGRGWPLFISLIFPIAFFVSYFKKCIYDIEFYYLLISLIVALGIFFVFYETGERANHGNFYWQIVIVMWLLFLFISKKLYKEYLQTGLKFKLRIFSSLYLFHFLSGVIYLIKIIILKDYS